MDLELFELRAFKFNSLAQYNQSGSIPPGFVPTHIIPPLPSQPHIAKEDAGHWVVFATRKLGVVTDKDMEPDVDLTRPILPKGQ